MSIFHHRPLLPTFPTTHTATNPTTNLARCFDFQKNFNPIDLLIAVAQCRFVEAVESLQKQSNWIA
jgi:hypothetical protein